MQARESDKGVRLIDAASGGNAQVELRSARTITQHGATVIARSGVNSVDFDHGNVGAATCRVECPRNEAVASITQKRQARKSPCPSALHRPPRAGVQDAPPRGDASGE